MISKTPQSYFDKFGALRRLLALFFKNIGPFPKNVGDFLKNVGDFLENDGVFSKNVGFFFLNNGDLLQSLGRLSKRSVAFRCNTLPRKSLLTESIAR